MDRSSGILIFSSAYIICILAIICLLQIKYDRSQFQNAELFAPASEQLGSFPEKPRLYVVRNPIKEDFVVQELRRNQMPNVLVATLPGENVALQNFAQNVTTGVLKNTPQQHIAGTYSLAGHNAALHGSAAKTAQEQDSSSKSGAWSLLTNLDQYLPTLALKNVARETTDQQSAKLHSPSLSAFPNADPLADPEINPSDHIAIRNVGLTRTVPEPENHLRESLESHLAIAYDYHNNMRLQEQLQLLLQTSINPDSVEMILNELVEIMDNGSLDPSLCESSLYRILDETTRLDLSENNPEDDRLLIDVKAELSEIIHHWIDVLNGVENEPSKSQHIPEQSPIQIESVDLQKLNIAIQSLILKRLF